jgi:spore coat protein U-like protein
MTKLGGKAGDILSYAVYLQGSTAIFGNRQGGGTEYDTIARRGAQFTDRILLEGVIPPRQDVSVGTYRDDLSVHVDF